MESKNKNSMLYVASWAVMVAIIGWVAFMLSNPGNSPWKNAEEVQELPKEILIESPDEKRGAIVGALGESASWATASTKEYEQIRQGISGTGASSWTGAIANTQTMQAKIAEMKRNGKEYLEDYLVKTYEGKGAFVTEKLLSLPLGDANAMERFLWTLSQFDPAALAQIGPALLQRSSFGMEFDQNSLEGYLSKNYSIGNMDYEKMKEMPIRNELGLLFLMTEIYYSQHKQVLDDKLEGVIAHKISLIPKNNIINPRYQNLNRIYSFFQVVRGKEQINAARTLRESQLQYLQAGNYPLLKAESDKNLFSEGSRILEKYKDVKSIEQAKTKDYAKDLAEAKALLAKMDASADFKKYYLGIVVFNNFIGALEIVNGNPSAAVERVRHNEGYQFVNADWATRPASSMVLDWNYSVAYEALGDLLASQGNESGAKDAYQSALERMTKYSHTRPHYVLPREQTKKLKQKIAEL